MIEKKNDYEGSHSRYYIRNIVSLIKPPEKINHFSFLLLSILLCCIFWSDD